MAAATVITVAATAMAACTRRLAGTMTSIIRALDSTSTTAIAGRIAGTTTSGGTGRNGPTLGATGAAAPGRGRTTRARHSPIGADSTTDRAAIITTAVNVCRVLSR